MQNKYAGTCRRCGKRVKARGGVARCIVGLWVVYHKRCAAARDKEAAV